MAAAAPPPARLDAPAQWRAVDCISDLHLDAAHPATLAALLDHLASTPADAVCILGDLFEVWVGDDVLQDAASFEARACALLRQARERLPIWFMHGNRDFLIGAGFSRATGIALLEDPTLLQLAGRRWLLSHGDALCLEDLPYQQFRAMVRAPEWQSRWLAQSLPERQAQARAMRSESEARKHTQSLWADVDAAAASAWLQAANAPTLVHGHTHRPAEHALADGRRRLVLSDWDMDHAPRRAQALRLSAAGAQRIDLAGG
ncbi:UDP-2,3-diacylglucosamine diphosphatase [Comamonas sp. NLF-1-9]|uniref:UDP-2,3-diacylglucosamine diphosphatase n=1 Tax=Comamonas sp. NLF-1-9 TaxID=2853163 RepID=UPI001C48BDF2|nr:UDP-2,3-diacylglucosamine diphosphatase [Comamonas sp. NLF-1-9]QXL83283.1 UDP-2,3-diacylglucosamine diphosphatase [Comamonas sp. NLF-1-9]